MGDVPKVVTPPMSAAVGPGLVGMSDCSQHLLRACVSAYG